MSYDYDDDGDAPKTVIAWIAGLLMGGLLVWVFSAPSAPSTPSGAEAEYKICGSEKCYYVESYTKETNCVFMAEHEVRVCGDYTISKINPEE